MCVEKEMPQYCQTAERQGSLQSDCKCPEGHRAVRCEYKDSTDPGGCVCVPKSASVGDVEYMSCTRMRKRP